MKNTIAWTLLIILGTGLQISQAVAQTAASRQEMEDRIAALERELFALKEAFNLTRTTAAEAKKEAATAAETVRQNNNRASNFHLAGYAAAGFRATDAGDVNSTFTGAQFNPIVLYKYGDKLLFEGEVEVEVEDDGGTDVKLEFANFSYLAHDAVTVVLGKFLSPLNQFQERLHPAWINKFSDRPAGFSGSGGLPAAEAGLMLRGGTNVGESVLNYAVFVSNGPQLNLSGGDLIELELEAFGDDSNSNKAVGGRVGFLPRPFLEVGASVMASKVEGKADAGTAGGISTGDYLWWGADAAYTRGGVDLRFEYFASQLDSLRSQTTAAAATSLIPKTEWEAWYVQGAYRLSEITEAAYFRDLEPVIRYGQSDADGFAAFVAAAAPENRLSFGLNYFLVPSAVIKSSLTFRDFSDSAAEDATEFNLQFAYGF